MEPTSGTFPVDNGLIESDTSAVAVGSLSERDALSASDENTAVGSPLDPTELAQFPLDSSPTAALDCHSAVG